MSDFETHIKTNPKAQRDEEALREAFQLLEELRKAGIEADDYALAPTFGGNAVASDPRASLSNLPSFYRS